MNKEKFGPMIPMLMAIFIVITFTITAAAQSPVGTWVDSRYNIKLVLKADYTYSLSFPGGTSQGWWSSQGQQFCLKDFSEAVPVCYTVISYSDDLMVLQDVNGVYINYKREREATENEKSPSQTSQVKTNRVLAKKNNYILTEDLCQHGIDLTQFVIGQKVKPGEVKELKDKLIEEFNQEPALVIQELKSIGESMKKVHQATDPVIIGKARQALFTALYKASRSLKEEQKPLIIQVINRYIKVLAYDEASGLVLTNKDIDGYINYLAFNSELAGQKIQVTDAVRSAVTQQIINSFSSMSLEQKQLLVSASLIWHLIEVNWQKLSEAQRLQYKRMYQSQIASNFTSNQPYNSNPNYSYNYNRNQQGSTQKSLDQMRLELNASQNMFNMMNNMSMNTHALSLNIIENTGGTGNYWKVTDY